MVLGFAYVYRMTGSIEPVSAVLVVLASLCVDMATTAFNSFFDYVKKVDSKQTNRESDKVLVHEGVPPAYALITSVVLYGFAGVLGLILTFLHGWIILALGVASLAVGYLYSGGPYPISRTPVGELFAGGFLGSVLFMIVTLTQGLELSTVVFLASVPSLIHIASILTVNNTCDIQGDTLAGRHTLSILLGYRTSVILIVLQIVAAYGTIFLTVEPQLLTAGIALAGFFLSAHTMKSMIIQGFTHETKGPSMGLISKSFMIYSIIYGVLLIL